MAGYWRLKNIEALLFLGLLIIVGVVVADSNENVSEVKNYPYSVAITFNDNYQCTGSIVGPYHVLTACACIRYLDPKSLKVRSGSNYWNQSGTLHNVISYACDPREQEVGNLTIYDVAVVVVNKPFEFDNVTRKIISLWKPDEEPLGGRSVEFASWGATSQEIKRDTVLNPATNEYDLGFKYESKYPDVIGVKFVHIYNRKECNAKLQPLMEGSHVTTHNCMKTPSISIKLCNGDAGASIIIDNQVAGIVAYEPTADQQCIEDFYSTDVTMSAKWIETFINTSTKVLEQAFVKNVSASTYGLNDRKIQAAEGNLFGTIDKASHVVSILKNDWYLCSGSIISASYVVTAAHCFKNNFTKELSIRAGSDYWYTGGSLHKVSKVITHPNATKLSTKWIYDVALVQIDDRFKFDSVRQQPITFFTPIDFDALYYPNMPAWQYGWEEFYVLEKGSEKAIIPSLRMQNVIANVEDAETCYGRARIPSQLLQENFEHHILCVKASQASNSRDSYGISGSGLVIDGKLAGIASQLSFLDNRVHEYTAISSVSDWIEWIVDPASNPKPSSFINTLQHNESITVDYVEDLKDAITMLAKTIKESHNKPKKGPKAPQTKPLNLKS